MEVHFAPEIEKRLNELAVQCGAPPGELVQDAVAIYAGDMAHVRHTLDSRYDDIKSNKVKLIPGEEVFERLHRKSEALRQQRGE